MFQITPEMVGASPVERNTEKLYAAIVAAATGKRVAIIARNHKQAHWLRDRSREIVRMLELTFSAPYAGIEIGFPKTEGRMVFCPAENQTFLQGWKFDALIEL